MDSSTGEADVREKLSENHPVRITVLKKHFHKVKSAPEDV
jgi:hypothetical protein